MPDRPEIDFIRCASCGLLTTRFLWFQSGACVRCSGATYREPTLHRGTQYPIMSADERAFVLATLEKHA